MPRTGYDVTGTVPGSPASEAAARARQRTAPRNLTPRAGTPANPPHPDGDEQETPRASRIRVPSGDARADSPTYSQMNIAPQDRRGFQIQRRMPRQELYQKPLKVSSIQASTSHPTTRPGGVPYGHGVPHEAHSSVFQGNAAPTCAGQGAGFVNSQTSFGAANFSTAHVGVQQQQQLWDSSQLHALPASQHGFQSRHGLYPNPESFAHSQTAAGTAQHRGPGSTGAATSASPPDADEDVEMMDFNG
ncbi:hypothetical protein Trco_005155 [Trichoderma cornu-damae]|uniref:Uncharacterized protein n=1 Tax=Trichoderma cornu-damae TaxID=654480 RepID=A0A9P8QNZ5_9HYPO|nr:hypothetical protein Trco_005154 [Trichoderma cornu-damae]KAH6606002.1 hypothetical protein Trco_005155 [Trichoderma cornu-damae]